MTVVNGALAYLGAHRQDLLEELIELARIPSISTLPEYQAEIARAAEFVAAKMRRLGLEQVEIMPTAGHPVVYGEWLHAPDKPTVLIYGHYDVQPADPVEEWTSPPFEPTVRGDDVYARGVSDMKGQVLAFLNALELTFRANGTPNANIKVIVEGEEEIGSPSLEGFLRQNREKLACTFSLNADGGMARPGLPAIIYGLRGLAHFDLWIQGPDHDLHSGVYGGVVQNPAQVLCELIAGMHDADGRVTLPGFYDSVRTLSGQERAELARFPYSEAEMRTEAGNPPALWGEKGYTPLERVGARPTLEVNGLGSGFTGAGSKTIIPSRALAKLSMRLIPHQDPDMVETQLREYLAENAPSTITWNLTRSASTGGVLTGRDSPAVRAMQAALQTVFGVAPIFQLEGGTIPVVGQVCQVLGADSVITGFGLPDDNLHAPNEKFSISNYICGIETYIRFLANL